MPEPSYTKVASKTAQVRISANAILVNECGVKMMSGLALMHIQIYSVVRGVWKGIRPVFLLPNSVITLVKWEPGWANLV